MPDPHAIPPPAAPRVDPPQPPVHWPLVAGDVVLAAALFHAQAVLLGRSAPGLAPAAWIGLQAALMAWACGLSVERPRPGVCELRRLVLYAVALLGIAAVVGRGRWTPWPTGELLWLAGGVAVAVTLFRLAWRAVAPRGLAAWAGLVGGIALAGFGLTLVLSPFVEGAPGGADFSDLVLADFVAQVRHGVFPVWLGQGEYLPDGSAAPLRRGSLFLHEVAVADALTFRRLDEPSLRLVVSMVNVAAFAGSAFAFLRSLLHRRPGVAGALTAAALANPWVLALLQSPGRAATIAALPFVPFVLHGLWRAWSEPRAGHEPWIAAGLAALWWADPPIALALTSPVAVVAVVLLLGRSGARAGPRRLVGSFVVFVILGGYPLLSEFTVGRDAAETTRLPAGELQDPRFAHRLLRADLSGVLADNADVAMDRPADRPVHVRSFLPYRASTYSAEPSWLETTRTWREGYRATANGRPAEVAASPGGQAMVRLNPGWNEVTLAYRPGFVVAGAYWLALAGWALVAVVGLVAAVLRAYFVPEGRSAVEAG